MKECPTCLEAYDSGTRFPRILPCGHTYCTACLDHMVVEGAIVCPSDRRSVVVGSVGDLPKNFIA